MARKSKKKGRASGKSKTVTAKDRVGPAQGQSSRTRGKGASKKRSATEGAVRTRRKLPNWPLLILCLAGAALAGFLTVTTLLEAEVPFCTAGSPCDVVQSSRWAFLLGAPIAFWGFLTYGALAGIAYRVKNPELHWKVSWTLSLIGLGVSLYLTWASLYELEAVCAYCLTSLAIMAAIFGLVAYQRPRGIADFAWPSWLTQTGGVMVIVVALLHLNFIGVFSPEIGEEDPYLRALAIHLSENEAVFYGADWCSRCERQKDLFEASAFRLPYVECSPSGQNAPQAPICTIKGIETYPTWVIRGRRYTAVLQPADLAKMTQFTGGAPPR